MDHADGDLRDFLETNDLQLPEKVELCYQVLCILRDLHKLGIYHRDIKPENILMQGGKPVFGDLGLISWRGKDDNLDKADERIGPVGFLSPEATNKCLGLRQKPTFVFDCCIDDKSDIFQLGQLFWFILQEEVPTGHLLMEDTRFPNELLFTTVIQPMLQYGKQRRANVGRLETGLNRIMEQLALS